MDALVNFFACIGVVCAVTRLYKGGKWFIFYWKEKVFEFKQQVQEVKKNKEKKKNDLL